MTAPIAPPSVEMPRETEVLVLRHRVAMGEAVGIGDLRWQSWPAGGVPKGAIHRKAGAAAPIFRSAYARFPLTEGEPIIEEKLVRPGKGGTVAALLAPGKRAIAVPLSRESAAGGLIQPHDRVDLFWTPRASERGTARTVSRQLLRMVRVLSIGKAGKSSRQTGASDRLATLELTPKQARIVTSAQASGDISLALIPATEIARLSADERVSEEFESELRPPVKIMKFGR